MKDDDEINEFAAAALVQMSPELLRSFTSRAPKKGESKKLPTKKVGAHRTYSRNELLRFDEYLRKPWPSEDGKRPHIPTPIQNEVKNECFLQCAVCHSHRDTCEIAHIEPVASSKCNHPHNLIYLCANHHTKFDKQGVLGPVEEVREYVAGFKKTLLYVTRVKWGSHANSIAECYSLAQLCQHLKKEIDAIGDKATAGQLGSYEKLADDAVERLKASTVKGKRERSNQKGTSAPEDLWAKLELSVQKPTRHARLASAAALTLDDEFRAAAGFVDCPLCEGNGLHGESVCPVCCGELQVDSAWVKSIDLEPYTLVRCPLCKGAGKHDGEDCPVCHGDRKMERRFADHVDVAAFDDVDCPLCEGAGQWQGDDCPECSGNCSMPRYAAERVDVSAYDEVDCPLCEGAGRWQGDDCPECSGNCIMPKHAAERVDVSAYDEVDCPLCEGAGRWQGDDCPECSGNCIMPKHAAERVDVSAYDEVNCPVCEGSGRNENGDDCRACGGECQIAQGQRDSIDLSDYKNIKCRLCNGSGQMHGTDCPPCGGEGTMPRWAYDETDWSRFESVTCSLCRGSGTHRGNDCGRCGGDGTILRQDAERDW